MNYKPGDKIEVKSEDGVFTGIAMPSENKNILFIKLSSGYNIGLENKKIKEIKVLEPFKETKKEKEEIKENKNLPVISIIHTGGTIASQVDYRTGGVVSRFSPEDLLKLVPEIKNIANIRTKLAFQMFSEDMEPSFHWSKLAEAVHDEIKNNVKGIIVGIGTDTLEYVASALSFALQNPPVPILIVGAQRSSDRPSSDAGINLAAAAHFIAKTDFKGVAVCMHENENDNNCLIIEGNFVKKMHTSRRDTFRPMNKKAIARVNSNGNIDYIRKDYIKIGKLSLNTKFSNKIGLIKIYPGFRKEELDWYEKNCDGLIVEAYAFGQMPINKLDEATAHHPALLEKIRSLCKKMPVVVVSQRPYGLTHMGVYSTDRDLLDAGVIEAKTLPHVAYAKLSWILGHEKNISEIRKLMLSSLIGERLDREEKDTFLI